MSDSLFGYPIKINPDMKNLKEGEIQFISWHEYSRRAAFRNLKANCCEHIDCERGEGDSIKLRTKGEDVVVLMKEIDGETVLVCSKCGAEIATAVVREEE